MTKLTLGPKLKPRPVYWLLLPACAYPLAALLATTEDGGGAITLVGSFIAAGTIGWIVRWGRGPAWEAPFATAWLPCALQAGGAYGRAGLDAPGGAASRLIAELATSAPPATLSLGLLLGAAGLGGWLFGALILKLGLDRLG